MAGQDMWRLIAVLDVLTSYNVLDDTGHIHNCGYTDEKPECKCKQMAVDLNNAIN